MARVWAAPVAVFTIFVAVGPVADGQTRRDFTPCVPTTTCGPAALVDSDDKVKQLEQAAAATANPEAWYFVAEDCLEKSKAAGLSAFDARRYALKGIQAVNNALAINSVYLDALRMKSSLLTEQARYESHEEARDRLLAEARLYRDSADLMAKRIESERRSRSGR
jgi:hypothetical protein